MKVPVAYWLNGLGEECSSPVFATFIEPEGTMAVVRNWRSREYEVRLIDELTDVRSEELHQC